MTNPDLEQRAIDVVRGLAMDAPHAARSGHQGTAMALAPLAHVLFTRIMNYDAAEPDWPDRDRFVLSAGHASILLYSMLYLTGYGLTLDDLKAFRQWGSATPGHPEVHHTKGVEVTTGPARPGLRQRRGHGPGRAVAARPVRRRGRRPPHVRRLRRRLPRGGHQPRGRLAGRAPPPRAARLHLRRQPRHHRRPHRAGARRRPGQAVRGLRLARRARRRDRQRPRRARGRHPSGHGRRRPPVAHRAAQPHRVPVARPHRRPGHPRLRPQGRRDHRDQGRHGHPRRAVLGARRRARPLPGRRPAGPGSRARPGRPATTPGRAIGPRSTRRRRGHGLPGWQDALPTFEVGRDDRHPRRQRAVLQRARRRSSPACSAAGPTSPATPAPSSRAPPSRPSTRPGAARSTSGSASTPWAAS